MGKIFGHIGQWIGLVLFIIALIVQLRQHSELQEICVVAASLSFTVATKVRYYGSRVLRYRRNKLLSRGEYHGKVG